MHYALCTTHYALRITSTRASYTNNITRTIRTTTEARAYTHAEHHKKYATCFYKGCPKSELI